MFVFCARVGNGFVFVLSPLFLSLLLLFLLLFAFSILLKSLAFPTPHNCPRSFDMNMLRMLRMITDWHSCLFSQPHHHFTRHLPSITLTTPLVHCDLSHIVCNHGPWHRQRYHMMTEKLQGEAMNKDRTEVSSISPSTLT